MNKQLLAMLVVTLVASGCSGEKADGGAAATTKASTAAAEPVPAVLQSTGVPVAKLEFVVATRPVVGRQSELRLDLSSTAAIPALQVRTESESITIDPATAQASVAVEAGKAASHQVRLVPKSAGLTEVTVRLRIDDGPEAVYVIPLLVAASAGG